VAGSFTIDGEAVVSQDSVAVFEAPHRPWRVNETFFASSTFWNSTARIYGCRHSANASEAGEASARKRTRASQSCAGRFRPAAAAPAVRDNRCPVDVKSFMPLVTAAHERQLALRRQQDPWYKGRASKTVSEKVSRSTPS
jgi:hypothetical protein